MRARRAQPGRPSAQRERVLLVTLAGVCLATVATIAGWTLAAENAVARQASGPVTDEMRSELAQNGSVVLSVTYVDSASVPDAPSPEPADRSSSDPTVGETTQVPVSAVLEATAAAELVVTDPAVLDALGADPAVTSIVIPPHQGELTQASSDDLRGAQQRVWIEASQTHATGVLGQSVTIAVVDSGVDTIHPDLSDSIRYERCFQIFGPGTCPDGTTEQAGPASGYESDGHGTQIAGLMVSAGTITVPGVAPAAGLESIRIASSRALDLRDVLIALDHLAAERFDVDVVVLSLGSVARFPSVCERDVWPAFHDTVAALHDRGVFITASAGDDSDDFGQRFPACLADVHAVAGLNVQGTALSTTTNSAPSTDLAAPASGLAVHDEPVTFGGTSMANALAAGCAALAIDSGVAGPEATAAWLVSTREPVTSPAGFAVPVLQCAPKCFDRAVTVNVAAGDQPTDGDDVILGTPGADVISAGPGDDLVCAGAGDDLVFGGLGQDRVDGGPGDDRLFGNFEADEVAGGPGNDTLHGNHGDDILRGDDGNDRIYGYTGDDTVFGGPGDDRLHGNRGNDSLGGQQGNDLVFGYSGDDTLDGGIDFDVCRGNAGADSVDRCEVAVP